MTSADRDEAIVIVGPVPPFKGGIAQHTDRLAREVVSAGLGCTVETWAAQYPSFLYPGEQYVPAPERVPSTPYRVVRSLRWYDPIGWVRCGIRVRRCSQLVFTMVIPAQAVAFLVIRAVASVGHARPRIIVVAHNVLPHEPRWGDRWLARQLLRFADRLMVHSRAEDSVARSLASIETMVVALPPHPPTEDVADRTDEALTGTLLFFGLVRPYKGLDDLLDALVEVPDVRLLVCGEVWGDVAQLRHGIARRGLEDRVELQDRYVDDADVADVFARCDALVLPYREGTGSQNALLGHQLGLPVIATDVAGFGEQISHGRTGFICPPDDPSALAEAIRDLYAPGVMSTLRANVRSRPDASTSWRAYVTTLLAPSPEGRNDGEGRET